ncbi:YwmB family TATA-box binding protein [Alkaliphilus peptidifermentans]|uniref:TATA-box binding n=1 Tax=Alkaliphilus peptidifermentans DSM 18978 TaxID=1120976 RepID=A0A1G5JG22_9FIRM|nr:YwmB family TATA-box binding protein [Alkaliphilus peptidifermentans]SCY87305.1 TATA-box binding [Alkaliphilus peptidifermentans DSM 18978]
MKKLLIAIILIITMLLIYVPAGAYFTENDNIVSDGNSLLIEAFLKSGADLMEVNTNNTLHLQDQFFTMNEMEKALYLIFDDLKIEGKINITENIEYYEPYYEFMDEAYQDTIFINKNSEIGYNQITATYIAKTGEITVVILYSFENDNLKESYIIIDIVQNKGYKDIVAMTDLSKEILSQFGNNIETTLCLVGSFPGEKSINESKIIVEEIGTFLKAKPVEEIIDKAYTSTTLYSPLLTHAISYQNKKVNLQLATRYNEYENRTYLWIATPLIISTY